MTITFVGHVESLRFFLSDKTIVTIRPESSVMIKPGETIALIVPTTIAKQYFPGTQFQATIYPLPAQGETK